LIKDIVKKREIWKASMGVIEIGRLHFPLLLMAALIAALFVGKRSGVLTAEKSIPLSIAS
jgi:hypothetical protein